MKKGDHLYQQYLNILEEELRPAMGCTEPIALAYAGAKARALLATLPERICVWVSGNIIKNVKSVVVPNTGGLHGIAAAVCAGVVVGEAERELEVASPGLSPRRITVTFAPRICATESSAPTRPYFTKKGVPTLRPVALRPL